MEYTHCEQQEAASAYSGYTYIDFVVESELQWLVWRKMYTAFPSTPLWLKGVKYRQMKEDGTGNGRKETGQE